MAAEATALALLSAGDHMIVHDDLYGGTYRLVTQITARQGVEVEFVNLRDTAALASKIRENTRLIWLESPTNPLMNVPRSCEGGGNSEVAGGPHPLRQYLSLPLFPEPPCLGHRHSTPLNDQVHQRPFGRGGRSDRGQ